MNKLTWAALFFLALILHINGSETGIALLQYISKPLLMPLLAGYLLTAIKGYHSPLVRWLLAALFFSWAGDVLLMFQANNSMFFLLGLSAFLLAHIFYIIVFSVIRKQETVPFKTLLLLPVGAYYGGLITLLYPGLGDMRIPVIIYGLVISTMFLLALHMLYIKNRIAGKWMMAGALLFVLSDSILAINMFYKPFTGAGILIMVTYGLAQFGIITGAVQYITAEKKSS